MRNIELLPNKQADTTQTWIVEASYRLKYPMGLVPTFMNSRVPGASRNLICQTQTQPLQPEFVSSFRGSTRVNDAKTFWRGKGRVCVQLRFGKLQFPVKPQENIFRRLPNLVTNPIILTTRKNDSQVNWKLCSCEQLRAEQKLAPSRFILLRTKAIESALYWQTAN